MSASKRRKVEPTAASAAADNNNNNSNNSNDTSTFAAAAREKGSQFCEFVDGSPSAFHACESIAAALRTAGFERLREGDSWSLRRGGKYYLTKNGSTIAAFVVGGAFTAAAGGFAVVGAHTDSPDLRVKPLSAAAGSGCVQVAVEPYGGGLWHTWFDRDLTVAGRVLVDSADGTEMNHRLVHIRRPILRIPNLAIHLTPADDRNAFKFSKQSHLLPVLATKAVEEQLGAAAAAAAAKEETKEKEKEKETKGKEKEKEKEKDKHPPILLQLLAEELSVPVGAVKDFDLSVCDTQPAALGGAFGEFIFSPRIDNLMSCFAGLHSLIAASADAAAIAAEPFVRLLCCYDHEEIGSDSAQGAGSAFTAMLLSRIATSAGAAAAAGDYERIISRSMLLSADMAHATHPNYPEKHEPAHQLFFGKGVAIKFNRNQRYATSAVTAALLRRVAATNGVPLQDFIVRNDSPCGSTIGPILSANCAIRTIDIGAPMLSMHSVREMASTADLVHYVTLITDFYRTFSAVSAQLKTDE